METLHGQAELFINDELVGTVSLRGVNTSWSFGEFTPNKAFSKYAPYFGQWSMLMHEDENAKLHQAAAEELRKAEIAIDRLVAKLHLLKTDEWIGAVQLNIDGTMIEWKLV